MAKGCLQKKNYVDREMVPKVGRGYRHSPIKIIPEIGNTPVLVGGSSKKFPINFLANSGFFVGKKGVISNIKFFPPESKIFF